MPAPHVGKWQVVTTDSKVVATHAALLRTGKVLYFHARSFPMWAKLFDPTTNQVSATNYEIPDWPSAPIEPQALFCAGHCFLPDGILLVAGGERPKPPRAFRGLRYTYIFNPASESWAVAPVSNRLMADGRWYPTLTAHGEPRTDPKRVTAMSGYSSDPGDTINIKPELYNPSSGWSGLPASADMPAAARVLYPGAHIVPRGPRAGKIFYSMPQSQSYVFDPFASPYWTAVAASGTSRGGGSSVLLPILHNKTDARVMILGGGDPATDTAQVIDLSLGSPTWVNTEKMFYARSHLNAVLLPDGKLLVVGGNRTGGVDEPVLMAEIFDPDEAVMKWTSLPEMSVARNYHSTALLLPDGRVWVGGGRVANGGDVEDDTEKRIEIYSPGFLFEGARPNILSAPSSISYTSKFTITTDVPIAAVVLIRPAATTHAIDMEQRYVSLAFTQGPLDDVYPWDVTQPANANIAPPGWYMLFVLRPKTDSRSQQVMIPSVARWVLLA